MAKNVTEDLRRRSAGTAGRRTVVRDSTTGRFGEGFRKTYSNEERDRMEVERREMRDRLLERR